MELVFLLVVAVVTTMAVPVVGTLLIFTLMVAPAGAARLLTDRPHRAILVSVVIAVATVWISIALAYLTNWPVGCFVGVGGAVSYALARIGSHWIGSRGSGSHGSGSRGSGSRGQLNDTRRDTTLLDGVTP